MNNIFFDIATLFLRHVCHTMRYVCYKMLNTCHNSGYKELAKQSVTRECLVSEQPVHGLIVDFRSRMFRYMRLTYSNRSFLDRVRSVKTAMKDLRIVGDVVTEKRNVFFATLVTIKKEVKMMQVFECTYVFPSSVECFYKKAKKKTQIVHTRVMLEKLKEYIEIYKTNMLDLEAMKRCVSALESYIISSLDSISSMYSGKEWMLGVSKYKVPDNIDNYESDRLCAKLAKEGCYAVLSEDLDVLLLFGADIIIKEVYKQFFVYISLKDIMAVFGTVSRKDAINRCCIMGTDYNMGLKGVGPVKAKKIDDAKAKQLFEICLAAQSIKPKDIYDFFLLST